MILLSLLMNKPANVGLLKNLFLPYFVLMIILLLLQRKILLIRILMKMILILCQYVSKEIVIVKVEPTLQLRDRAAQAAFLEARTAIPKVQKPHMET